MKLPVTIDERFLTHRLRSSSSAGIAAALLAILLAAWHYYVDGFLDWDLLAVAVAFIVIKWTFMAWYRWTD